MKDTNFVPLTTYGGFLLRIESESTTVVSLLQPDGLYNSWNSPGQNIGVDISPLLQGILPTQGSNVSLPRCRQIRYQLSYQGSPCITIYCILMALKCKSLRS